MRTANMSVGQGQGEDDPELFPARHSLVIEGQRWATGIGPFSQAILADWSLWNPTKRVDPRRLSGEKV